MCLPSLFLSQSLVRALDPCTSAGGPEYHNDDQGDFDHDHDTVDDEVMILEVPGELGHGQLGPEAQLSTFGAKQSDRSGPNLP